MELRETANLMNSYFLKHYFDINPEIDWVIIAREPGNIIACGTMEDEPFGEDLERIAKKINLIPFSFLNPNIPGPIIEEFCLLEKKV